MNSSSKFPEQNHNKQQTSKKLDIHWQGRVEKSVLFFFFSHIWKLSPRKSVNTPFPYTLFPSAKQEWHFCVCVFIFSFKIKQTLTRYISIEKLDANIVKLFRISDLINCFLPKDTLVWNLGTVLYCQLSLGVTWGLCPQPALVCHYLLS